MYSLGDNILFYRARVGCTLFCIGKFHTTLEYWLNDYSLEYLLNDENINVIHVQTH
jgi:hypothetical protein